MLVLLRTIPNHPSFIFKLHQFISIKECSTILAELSLILFEDLN